MQIPTEHDWGNPYDGLDVEWAHKHFFGKTIEEAEELFVENALCYQEDIMWMPSIPFRYYVHAYMNYLLGEQSKHDTDAASCFLGLIEFKLDLLQDAPSIVWARDNQNDIRDVWVRVKETIEHIRKNPDWFDWDESIYGNLEKKTTRLLSWES